MSGKRSSHRRWVALVLVAIALSGCNRYGYEAHIDGFTELEGRLAVDGWFRDVLADRRPGACAANWVSVDGGTARQVTDCANFEPRPDFDAAHGAASFPLIAGVYGLGRGPHRICVQVTSPGAIPDGGAPDDTLDCADVNLKYDQFDAAHIDSVGVSGGVLQAEGWYRGLSPTSAARLYGATWEVDGRTANAASSASALIGATVTIVARPDVVSAVGPGSIGLRLSMPVTPGTHRVCLVRDNGFGARWGASDCTTVTA